MVINMLTQTRTKIYTDQTPGIPLVNSNPGTLVTMLDAVLVNGFNSKSIENFVLSSGVATITSTSHGYVSLQAGTPDQYFPVIQIVGLDPALDGQYRIQSIPDANTITINVDSPDKTLTSTGSFQFAPAGWSIAYTDNSHKRVYRQINVQGSRFYLRIDDSKSRALITVYKTMTDIDTGTWPVPATSQSADNQLEWGHVVYSSSGPSKFFNIFADDLIFYLFMENPNANQFDTNNYVAMVFGDIITLNESDNTACVISGAVTKNYTGENVWRYYGFTTNSTTGNYLVDDPNAAASTPLASMVLYNTGRPILPFQDPFTQTITYTSLYLGDTTNNSIRGIVPGMYDPWFITPHNGNNSGSLPSPVTNRSVIPLDDQNYGILTYSATTDSDRAFGSALVFSGSDWR